MIKPMLCRSHKEPFDDEDWAFEEKLDGERCIAIVLPRGTPTRVGLWTRTGKSATMRYPEVAEALLDQTVPMILDGEICAYGVQGVADFQLLSLRSRLQNPDKIRNRRATTPVYYRVFDILEVNGHDLREVRLYGRNTHLVENLRQATHVQIVDAWRGSGVRQWTRIKELGGEGIVAKRRDSTYQEGKRSPDWLKIKFTQDEDFHVVGFTEGLGKRAGLFGALVLGEYRDGVLRHVGSVGTGFSDEALRGLLPVLESHEYEGCPFVCDVHRTPEARTWSDKTRWLIPGLVAKISYANRTDLKLLRFPVFRGLRDD